MDATRAARFTRARVARARIARGWDAMSEEREVAAIQNVFCETWLEFEAASRGARVADGAGVATVETNVMEGSDSRTRAREVQSASREGVGGEENRPLLTLSIDTIASTLSEYARGLDDEDRFAAEYRCCRRFCLRGINLCYPDWIGETLDNLRRLRAIEDRQLVDSRTRQTRAQRPTNAPRRYNDALKCAFQFLHERGACNEAKTWFVSRYKIYALRNREMIGRRSEEDYELDVGAPIRCCVMGCMATNFRGRTKSAFKYWRRKSIEAKKKPSREKQQAIARVAIEFCHVHPTCCPRSAWLVIGISRVTFFKYRRIAKAGGYDAPLHGLKGLKARNFDVALSKAIERFCDRCVVGSPNSTDDLCAYINDTVGAEGKRGLWRLFRCEALNNVCEEDPPQLWKRYASVPWSTFRDGVMRYMAKNGFRSIRKPRGDHNVCTHCKALTLRLAYLQFEFYSLRQRLGDMEAARVDAAADAAAADGQAHEVRDRLLMMYAEIVDVTLKISRHLFEDQRARNIIDWWTNESRNSYLAQIRTWHCDAETARQLPSMLMKSSQDTMRGYRVPTIAFHDCACGNQQNYLLEHGIGKEDTSLLIHLIALELIKLPKGTDLVVVALDNFIVNYNSQLWAAMQFFVDELELVPAIVLAYYKVQHGKGPADARFGQHARIHETFNLITDDQFAWLIEQRVNSSDGRRTESCSMLQASGIDDWSEWFRRRTENLAPMPSTCKIKAQEWHEVAIVRENIRQSSVSDAVKSRLERFIDKPGFVAFRRFEDDGVVKYCFRPSNPPLTLDPLRPRLQDAKIPEPDENTRRRELTGVDFACNRSELLRNGWRFCKLTLPEREAIERDFGKLLPENWLGTNDKRVQYLTHIERRPAVKDDAPATGALCPSVMYSNVVRGRRESDASDFIFVDHRPSGVPFLPLVCDATSQFYDAILAFGESVRPTPGRLVRLSDILSAICSFSFETPSPPCTLADWKRISPTWGHLSAFRYAPTHPSTFEMNIEILSEGFREALYMDARAPQNDQQN